MNLEELVTGHGHIVTGQQGDKLWRLTVWGSGVATLNKVGGLDASHYDDGDFRCNAKDLFRVITPKYSDSQDWEAPVVDIKLTLDSCKSEQDGGKKRICDIKINDNVGLKWHPNFKSKVTLLA